MGEFFLSGLRRMIIGVFFSTHVCAQVPDIREIDYTRADSVAALYPGHSLDDIKLLSDRLTKPLSTDIEKFRAIYKWVCDNIENDPHNFQTHAYKKKQYQNKPDKLAEWNPQFSRDVFKKLRREYKTVCTGYASLVKELAYHAGITCKIVNGYGRTVHAKIGEKKFANHSWNAVNLGNNWYLCDATWSSGSIDLQQKRFIPQFGEMYFLTEPSLFAMNHYPLDTGWLLINGKPSLSRFFNGPLIYKGALNHHIYPIFPETFELEVKKGGTISFQFRTERSVNVDDLKLQIVQGNKPKLVSVEVQQYEEGLYSLDYKFSRRGVYVVHLKLGSEYLITYSVRVLK